MDCKRTVDSVAESPPDIRVQFLSIPDFGFHAEKGTAGSCDRSSEPPHVPKLCYGAFGARLAVNVKLDPACLKKLPGQTTPCIEVCSVPICVSKKLWPTVRLSRHRTGPMWLYRHD